MFRSLIVFAILTGVSGCAAFSGKVVARKDPPNVLVADDGSICIVSKDRFDKAEVGLKVLCGWKGGGLKLEAARPRNHK